MEAVILLRAHTGHDLSPYKSTLYRRIKRRMHIHPIDKIADYVRYLQANPEELNLLIRGNLLIYLASDLRYPGLADDAREVLRTLVSIERPIATHDGRRHGPRTPRSDPT